MDTLDRQRRRFLQRLSQGAALAALPGWAGTATAQTGSNYPAAPVRVLVPTAAGGSLDTLARLLAGRLEQDFGQTFVVENKPGANGNLAFETATRATPDGLTLLLASDAITINPFLYSQVHYDPVRGYAPVSLVCTAAQVLVVHPGVPARSLTEFTELARQRAAEGRPLNIASPGAGSAGHLAAVLYQQRAKVNWTHVPYKGGGPAVADLLGGHVDGLFVTLASAVPQIQAKGLVALAVTTPTRSVALPDVPTIAEAALPGFDVTNWEGLFAPPGTAPAIVDALQQRVVAAAKDRAVRERLLGLGFEPVAGGPEVLAKLVRDNTAKWQTVIKQANIHLE